MCERIPGVNMPRNGKEAGSSFVINSGYIDKRAFFIYFCNERILNNYGGCSLTSVFGRASLDVMI
jgi:hypothetical protein